MSALSIEIDDLGREAAGLAPFAGGSRSLAEIEDRLALLLALQRRFRTDEAGLIVALQRARVGLDRVRAAQQR